MPGLIKEVHTVVFLFFLHVAPVSDLTKEVHTTCFFLGGFFFPWTRLYFVFLIDFIEMFLGSHDYGRVEGDAQGQENPPGGRGAISV